MQLIEAESTFANPHTICIRCVKVNNGCTHWVWVTLGCGLTRGVELNGFAVGDAQQPCFAQIGPERGVAAVYVLSHGDGGGAEPARMAGNTVWLHSRAPCD